MELLQTKDYLLFIDEERRGIEFGEIGVNMRHSNLEPETRNIGGYGSDKFYWSHKKIIAYHPLNSEAKELDLPLLPNPFEEDITKLSIQDLDDGEEGISNIDIKNWIKGYKAVQSKQFSLDDMKKAISFGRGLEINSLKESTKDVETAKFIQSLSTQQLPKQFIPKFNKNTYVINSEGKEEIVGTYKY